MTSTPSRPCCVVAGTGSIGTRHLRLLGRQPGVTALALPTRAGRRPELQAEGFEVVAGWDEAYERGATHAVIATNTGRHGNDAALALSVGCHVLVEKPMTPEAATARDLAQRAHDARRGLWVGCDLRFQAALNHFRERLPDIGRVHEVRIECQSYLPDWRPDRPYRLSYSARADEGGVLRDLIHEIDYAGWLFGWPSAVQGRTANRGVLGIHAEEEADLLWESASGAIISIRLDYLSRPTRRRMTASGEFGTLAWDGVCGTVTASLAAGAETVETFDEIADDIYAAQAAAFLSASLHQHDPRMATADQGIRALSICDAARRSSVSGREEQVASS